ncbi:MAG TPA: metal-dependent transcriptional regulator [Thermodesulfobacteriota bacterium]|nr:metal-dependent transcriptional regulator [Thermodesulfobacteriota bacterium]
MDKTLTSAMEDYLELIIKLKQENKIVRVRDIARGMQVKMPSVTSMLNNLAKKNLITHERYEYVDLTPLGLKQAQKAIHKHMILFNFLKNVLRVNSKQADNEACRMEHTISPATLKKLVKFIGFIESCPKGSSDFWEYFKSQCQQGSSKEECREHLQDSLEHFFSQNKSKPGGKDDDKKMAGDKKER